MTSATDGATSRSAARAGEDGRVAVVGSGVAGAGAAFALRETELAVTVFEREAAVGGRAATGRRNDAVYDYGANYAKPGTERVATLIRDLDEGDLVDVAEPVWTFDADGAVGPGDEERADDHKWTFEDGLATLPRRLLERTGAVVRTEAPVRAVTRVRRNGRDRWYLDVAGQRDGPYDAVVLTPPGPETAALLSDESDGADGVDGGTAPPDDRIATIAAAARSITYRPIRSVVLHYPFAIEVPYYALVNVDRDHPIGWVSREEAKRGHVPPGETVLIVQLSPARTRETRGRSDEAIVEDAAGLVASLVDDDRLEDPDWHAIHAFDRALPEEPSDGGTVDPPALDAAASLGLSVAGDWVVGDGRIHAALAAGLDAGDRLREANRRLGE